VVYVIKNFKVKHSYTLFFTLIILFILVLSTPVMAESGVVVTGQADINSDQSLARDEALEDAFLKAVQKSIGTYINRSVQVEDYQLINASTYSKVEGFISDYEIINEGTDEAGEVYQVEIIADVKPAALSELDNIQFVLETQTSNPRIYADLESGLQQDLHNQLQELGFLTVDQIDDVSNNADIIISGDLRLENLPDYHLRRGPLKVRQAVVDLEARNGNGQRLAQVTGFSKGYGSSAEIAEEIALEKSIVGISQELASQLLTELSFNSSGNQIRLDILNLSDFRELENIDNMLAGIRSINSIDFRSYNNGTASYDLKAAQASQQVAAAINNQSDRLKVLEVNSSTIIVSFN